ncbi:MAG: hypothetical protein UX65_C0015G0006 [Parcubacteria group bacterium GW2011_GWB1_46_8]|nr:MAG: hypothetical protein UX14_C0038G0003 [Parcubacteria group bacterium GW2011_GWF1_45_5]KKU11302.1 MAG: hypothetical protein UX15_C0010G0006 [Parcubacteria group bacterium GW2011_GWA1_45_7]KKU43921.1 MAG: hypothetical protein UX61_C0008G0005 [Parcubacteria group bacterium GW2011_GWA2_46_7]KKU45916.1 MAG: hypothetical protein UX65_C0015G0006 [Parcubacteria group bacterium GW2011_GWB1_46_8]
MEIFLTFAFLLVTGLIFGAWYGKKTRGFRWKEYLALLIIPMAGVIWLTYKFGPVIIVLYGISAMGGTFMEYLFGFAYHKAAGRMLWTYNKMPIHGYTSILSIPFWGIAGIFFLLMAKAFMI